MLRKASLADDSGLSEDKFNAAERRKDKQIGKVISLQPLKIVVADVRDLRRHLRAKCRHPLCMGGILSEV